MNPRHTIHRFLAAVAFCLVVAVLRGCGVL